MPRRSEIGVVVYDFRASSLAASARARALQAHFSSRGYPVRIYAAKADAIDNQVNLYRVADWFRGGALRNALTRVAGIPDPMVFWSISIFMLMLWQRLRGDLPGVIIVSSPPHGMQLLALLLKALLRRSVISDMRDIFVENHRARWPTPLHRYGARVLERKLVETVDLVVLNTPVALRMYQATYPQFNSKLHCVSNGYQTSSCESGGPAPVSAMVAYVGSDYSGFAPSTIAALCDELRARKIEGQIITAGPGDWSASKAFDNWTHEGLVSPAAAAAIIRHAKVCLLLMPPGERSPSPTVPLKAYEYLASPAEIVYLGEVGASTELLGRFPGTHCFQRGAISELASMLADKGGPPKPVIRDVSSIHFSALMQDYLNLLTASGILPDDL